MKLSIVVICRNDFDVLGNCLRSVYEESGLKDFEVILTDNGSEDGSVEYVRKHFPKVRILENGGNLGFGPGNNAGFRLAQGDYVLILNPDTVIHRNSLDRLVAFADRHPEAGAIGCRVLNPDGTLQGTAQPRPTVRRYLLAALGLRRLGRYSESLLADGYVWDGRMEREIGFQAACCLLLRGPLLRALGGFDERFLHQFEDADLCHRVWNSGSSVLYCPEAEITHIGGQNRGRYPAKVVLETQRSKYRYFFKHYGPSAAVQIRWVSLIAIGLRFLGYRLVACFRSSSELQDRLQMYRVLWDWHRRLDPIRFASTGQEPDVGHAPLITTPRVVA